MTVAVAALAAVIASSAGALEVSLDVERCPSLASDHMFRLVALELDARVVTPERAGEQTARVQVACTGADVQLEVSDRLTGKLLTRTMTLGDRDAQVSARLIAIAVAELVLTSWMELTLPGAGRRCARRAGAAARRARARPAPPPAPRRNRLCARRGPGAGPFRRRGCRVGRRPALRLDARRRRTRRR